LEGLFLSYIKILERQVINKNVNTKSSLMGLWKRKRNGGATGTPTLIQPEDTPHHSRVREHQKPRYTPMYRVPQVPQKTQFSELSFLPSLAFLHAGTQKMYGFGFIASFAFVLRPPISAAAKVSG
jgi:hypothetical protein